MATVLSLFWSCCKIGLLAFGGGNAAIPLLEEATVPRWLSQQEFGELVGINFAFPGVSILKLAGVVGLRAAGIPGLLAATVGLAMPGLLLTLGAYSLLTKGRDHHLVRRALLALQYAAAALLASSALKTMQSASGRGVQPLGIALVVLLFAAVHVLRMAPVLTVLLGVAVGMVIL